MAMYRNHRQPPKAWTAWLDGWTLDMQARGMSGQTVESYWYRVTSSADRLRHTPEQGHGRADPGVDRAGTGRHDPRGPAWRGQRVLQVGGAHAACPP